MHTDFKMRIPMKFADESRNNRFQNAKNREIRGVGRKQAANTAGVQDGG